MSMSKGPLELGYTRDEYLALCLADVETSLNKEQWPGFRQKLRTVRASMTGEGEHQRQGRLAFPDRV